MALDDLDRKIVRHLQRNARVPNTEIARALDVTETTIRNRVSRLVEDRQIEIVAVVNPKAIDATISAFLLFSVALGALEEVAEALRNCQEMRYVATILGRGQILTESFFRDAEHLVEFQNGFLATVPGILSVETSLVVKVNKLSYEWEI